MQETTIMTTQTLQSEVRFVPHLQDVDLDDDIELDMADEYDDRIESRRNLRVEYASGEIDFSMLRLKSNHANKPLWVCPNFHIYLDVSSKYYEQVLLVFPFHDRRPTFSRQSQSLCLDRSSFTSIASPTLLSTARCPLGWTRRVSSASWTVCPKWS